MTLFLCVISFLGGAFFGAVLLVIIVVEAMKKGGEPEMSEYVGGPLDELADLFMRALRTDDPHEKNLLIDEWNKKIKFINSVLKGR